MRITAILLLVASLHVCAKSEGQTVTLDFQNVPIQKVLKEVSRQTGISIIYNETLFTGFSPVTVKVKDVTIQDLLKTCLNNQPFDYSFEGGIIVISKRPDPAGGNQFADHLSNPPFDIHGLVTDSLGIPLAGASISVKGSKRGTMSGIKGDFTLTGVSENSILIISYTGYKSKQIKVTGESMTVFLVKSQNPLDEIQIIAYGSTSKRLNIGDVSTVKSEVIDQQPVTNPLSALEGRVPGLYIQEYSGVPGTSYKVQLRGQNSISSGNDPYYIIDDIPFPSQPVGSSYINGSIIGGGSPLSSINPSDIESIEILKDAEATAIYGSQGANGVIIITTKKGKSGETRVDLGFNSGIGQITRQMDLLNTKNYLIMRNEAFSNDQEQPGLYDYDLTVWDTTRYTDWQKMLIGNHAFKMSADATVSGGNKNTQFLITGAYGRETTVFPGDFADNKGSVHLNLSNSTENQRFKSVLNATYMIENSNLPFNDLTPSALTLSPDAPPVFDSAGKLNWSQGFSNPYASLWSTYNGKTHNLISNLVLSYQLTNNLMLKANLGYNDLEVNELKNLPSTAINPAYSSFQQPTSYFGSGSQSTWIVEPQLIWQKASVNNQWNILIGTTFQQTSNSNQSLVATGYTSDNLLGNITAAASISTLPSNNYLYRYTAFFGRISYGYQNKYLINLTGRRDGSSRFGPGKQFADFGAIGLGWIFSSEHFINQAIPALSFGKLRASYGSTGNDQIGNYQYLSNWIPTQYPYQSGAGLYPQNLANSNYSWEINKKMEVGLDLGFFKEALLFNVSYFNNRSSNQLVGLPLPTITGFSSVQANLPAVVQNTGWEFQVSSTNIKSNNFTWTSSFNLTIPSNLLVSYPGLSSSVYANTYQVGKSLYTKKAFVYTGVDVPSGVYFFEDLATGKPTGTPVYPDDLQANKQVSQQYFGGFLNTFSYKGWQLDIFLQFVKQTARNYMSFFGAPGFLGNQPNFVLSRWQKPGDQTNVQQFTQDYSTPAYTGYSNASYFGDNTISDASFIRCKNVSLSYQFSENMCRQLKIKALNLYVRVQNLFTITHNNYMGMDPEPQYFGNLPPLGMIIGGFKITL